MLRDYLWWLGMFPRLLVPSPTLWMVIPLQSMAPGVRPLYHSPPLHSCRSGCGRLPFLSSGLEQKARHTMDSNMTYARHRLRYTKYRLQYVRYRLGFFFFWKYSGRSSYMNLLLRYIKETCKHLFFKVDLSCFVQEKPQRMYKLPLNPGLFYFSKIK